jgi:hypothetical protein
MALALGVQFKYAWVWRPEEFDDEAAGLREDASMTTEWRLRSGVDRRQGAGRQCCVMREIL